ncbi:hypothetical protein [Pseudomonas sp.]|uniref:hypothetical protein n=1 Tax=Pseudomonas sp. TaxID=306 RepID=UPI0031DD8EEC
MREIWYDIGHEGTRRAEIKPVIVVKKTEKKVTVLDNWGGRTRESLQAKVSAFNSYFPTFEEAKEELIKRAQSNVEDARFALQRANDVLGNAKGLKPPSIDHLIHEEDDRA